MIIQNSKFSVKITLDDTYTVNSADNAFHYDKVLYAREILPNDYYKTLSIKIDNGTDIFKIALIGDYFSYDFDCAVLNGNILTVMQNCDLTSINLSDFEIVKSVKLTGIGTNYGIYPCKCGYLIYGETEITLLDFDFNVQWSFMGRDIFVSQNSNKPFDFNNDKIMLFDWENNYYELDYDGNLIIAIQIDRQTKGNDAGE